MTAQYKAWRWSCPITELRSKAKASIAQLADKSGVPPGQINSIETGIIVGPKTTTISKIAGALGISTPELVDKLEQWHKKRPPEEGNGAGDTGDL